MKIELKNVKYFAAGSNDGHGGNTNLDRALYDLLTPYAQTLPKRVSNMVDSDDPTGFFTYKQDAESLVDDILAEYLTRRDMKRLMSKRILFTKGGSDAVYKTSVVKPEVMAKFRTDAEFRIKTITKLGAVCILNLLPEETALKLFNRGA